MVLSTRPSIADTIPMRPDQFSAVSVHSIAAWWLCAMETKRRLRSVVSRPRPARKRNSRPAAPAGAEGDLAPARRGADVVGVAVVQPLDVVEADRVLALDAQLEHQP